MIDQARQRDARDSGSDGEPIRVTRRQAMAMGATAPLAVVSSPLTDATNLGSDLLRANIDRFGGWSPREETILHDGQQPAVHIAYTEGDKADLQEWVDGHEDRSILRENDPIRTATVKVLPSDLQVGLYDDGLQSLSWVDESEAIDLNIAMSYPEPVDLGKEPSGSLVEFSGLESYVLRFSGFDAPGTEDIAFDDAESGTVREACQVTGASDSFISNTDTSQLTVAVIDTGLDHANGAILGDTTRVLDASRDLTASGDPTVGEQGIDVVSDDAETRHGSHVAGIIAANPADSGYSDYRGYLPACDLLILRALTGDGGSTKDISRAVTLAADEGADVICMSLGSPVWSVELERALSYAVSKDAIPVLAAGNNRMSPQPFVNSPADAPNVITVAAGEVRPASETRAGSFSAVGPDPGTVNFSGGATEGAVPDIAAPGVKVEALVADSTNSPETLALSGTSMAAPAVVGGGVGLLLAASNVDHDLESVRDRITEYAQPAPKFGVYEAGAGWLDVEAAVIETAPDETQEEARNDQAQARDQSWEQLSQAYGRRISRLLL